MNEIVIELINTYGPLILRAVLLAISGWLAVVVKNLVTRFLNGKTAKALARVAVRAVEQLYQEAEGEEKLKHALDRFSQLLANYGIEMDAENMRTLIEDAVGEFNGVFDFGVWLEQGTDISIETE